MQQVRTLQAQRLRANAKTLPSAASVGWWARPARAVPAGW